nr:xanthine phosphoribosyltransferase [Ligilactobacillus pobuzihii]
MQLYGIEEFRRKNSVKFLEKRIREDGLVLPGNVLKVNSFLNHQIDPELMNTIGQEFAHLFRDNHITRILTVESSGIAPAIMTGLALHVPVLFARKTKSSTMNTSLFTADVYSYTKKVTNTISVDQKFLLQTDNVLVIDDFLANGQAVSGLLEICKQADAHVEGVGIVVEKAFQNGGQLLRDQGVRLESLAQISSFADDKVHFVGE